MSILIAIIFTVMFIFLYKRYTPIIGVKKIDELNRVGSKGNAVLVDIRDYQTSCQNTTPGTVCIPLPYLIRHYVEIPLNKNIILITADLVEKNLATRLLRKKGLQVIGYYLTEDLDKEKCHYGIQYSSQK